MKDNRHTHDSMGYGRPPRAHDHPIDHPSTPTVFEYQETLRQINHKLDTIEANLEAYRLGFRRLCKASCAIQPGIIVFPDSTLVWYAPCGFMSKNYPKDTDEDELEARLRKHIHDHQCSPVSYDEGCDPYDLLNP